MNRTGFKKEDIQPGNWVVVGHDQFWWRHYERETFFLRPRHVHAVNKKVKVKSPTRTWDPGQLYDFAEIQEVFATKEEAQIYCDRTQEAWDMLSEDIKSLQNELANLKYDRFVKCKAILKSGKNY